MRIFELEITPLETSKQSALESKRAVVSWIESNTSLEIVETMSVRDTENPTALFDDSNALPFLVYGEEKALREMESTLTQLYAGCVTTILRDLPASTWQSAWDEAPASFVTPSFHVILDDDPVEPEPTKQIIHLGSYDAFGNGQHATTRACLDLIEARYPAEKWQSVLDLGTGTGILAIALAKLGCERVVGTEIADELVEAARANAERNSVDGTWVNCGSPSLEWEPFDVIVSNILIPVLYDLLPACRTLLKPRGSLILAGFIAKELDELTRQAGAQGFRLVEQLDVRGWLATRWMY